MQTAIKSLEDAKAFNIVTINLSGKTTFADYMVVVSGRSGRHVNAIANNLLEYLKSIGLKKVVKEGSEKSDWVLIDAGDILVHIFRPQVRDFYKLEKIWAY